MSEMVTLDEFERMVDDHDLTYEYSDDGGCWRRGGQSLAKIKAAAKYLNHSDVVRVWNAAVDRKIVEGSRENFYWKDAQ